MELTIKLDDVQFTAMAKMLSEMKALHADIKRLRKEMNP